jgi:hypothetical protein
VIVSSTQCHLLALCKQILPISGRSRKGRKDSWCQRPRAAVLPVYSLVHGTALHILQFAWLCIASDMAVWLMHTLVVHVDCVRGFMEVHACEAGKAPPSLKDRGCTHKHVHTASSQRQA